jgi:hypothetical protein
MTVKLAILKSGEDIISNIQELVVEDKVVGYIFDRPCCIKMQLDDGNKSSKDSVKIRLTPWIILTKDKKIPVPLDWVITLVNPIDKLKQMYEEDILKNGKDNQSFSTTEQSDTDNAD